MESPQLDLVRNTRNQNKLIKVLDHKKINGVSFWVSLLSILVYVSVFYMFDLSPSSLLNTTKFWFFISNTLILIIAADFGAFTLSANHDDQQLMYNYGQQRSTAYPPSKTTTPDHLPSFNTSEDQQDTVNVEIDVSTESATGDARETQLKRVTDEIEPEEKTCDDSEVIEIQVEQPTGAEGTQVVSDQEEEEIVEKKEVKCVRSMSEKVILPAGNNEDDEDERENNGNVNVLRRSKSEGRQREREGEEQNEFSTMSDEELNRRVEEFIQMFNRQIRLQGAQHRRMLASRRPY